MTDKPALSGAEFQRAVGADPKKWAEAFMQAATSISGTTPEGDFQLLHSSRLLNECHTREERVAWVAQWFRDAQEAAVKAAGPSWPPQPDDSDPGMKA